MCTRVSHHYHYKRKRLYLVWYICSLVYQWRDLAVDTVLQQYCLCHTCPAYICIIRTIRMLPIPPRTGPYSKYVPECVLGRLLCKIFLGSRIDPFCPFCLWLHFWTSLFECRILCAAPCKIKHFAFFVLYGDHTYHVWHQVPVPGTRNL